MENIIFKIAAVVVLYNPEIKIKTNIQSYEKYMDKIYCIDNSEQPNPQIKEVLEKNPKCEHYCFYQNRGLANALDVGCNLAKKEGYSFVMTMDQDSCFKENSIMKLVNKVSKQFAVIAPNIVNLYGNIQEKPIYDKTIVTDKWVITSGSIVNLQDYFEIKGFDKKLFIGQIDIDFCYRLQKVKKKILIVDDCILYQVPGNTKEIKLFCFKFHPPHINKLRYYYLVRNQIYLISKYGYSFKKYAKIHLYKYFFSIVFFEKNKREKIQYFFRGFIDGVKKKMEKYEER